MHLFHQEHQTHNPIELLPVNIFHHKKGNFVFFSSKDSAHMAHDSIDYIPPELSLDDHQNSDVCILFIILF
jgi:hypothetical protein